MTKDELLKKFGVRSDGNLNSLRLTDGKTVEQELAFYALKLQNIIYLNTVDAYKKSKPAYYVRTWDLVESIDEYSITTTMKKNTIIATCSFSDKSIHPSCIKGYGPANTMALLDRGFSWSNMPDKVHTHAYFHYRPAGNIGSKSKKQFNEEVNKLGVDIIINIGSNSY